ncbi:hypothetical protein HY311_02890 [Candidatus Nomurabacteria bacterium]|nr:hypothetical protein [Candidatus Nomurabacteria bacterium]
MKKLLRKDYMDKSIAFTKRHKLLTFFFIILMISFIYMAFTGTVSYPYILIDRQTELVKDCAFGTNNFTASKFGYSFSVPKEYCILPNRLFPEDGSIEITPRGWYFVINEYAKGTIAEGAKATLLFEPVVPNRNVAKILQNLMDGGFLSSKNISETKNASGLGFVLASKVLGADGELYDWAFTTRPDNKYFLAVVTRHSDDQTVGKNVLDTLTLTLK